MKHLDHVWNDPTYAQEPIPPLVAEWLLHLESRPRPVSAETTKKYRNSLLSFVRSLEAVGEPAVLGSVTRAAVDRWTSQQRFNQLAGEGIASRLAALKAFTRSYLWQEAEYTTVDLLEKVKRVKTPEGAKPMLEDDEREAIFAVFDGHTYADVRNDAFIGAMLATGLRYKAVLEMDLAKLDRASGELVVVEKGAVERPVRLSPGAMKKLRRWLRIRKAAEGVDRVWTTDAGQPLSYWGGQSMFKRLKQRSGVGRLHPHLLRHTFGQGAMLRGATPGEAQDMLGHKTQAMTRRYTNTVRASTAAANMPKYALL